MLKDETWNAIRNQQATLVERLRDLSTTSSIVIDNVYPVNGMTLEVLMAARATTKSRVAQLTFSIPEKQIVEIKLKLTDEDLRSMIGVVQEAVGDLHFKCSKAYYRNNMVSYFIRPDWKYWNEFDKTGGGTAEQ